MVGKVIKNLLDASTALNALIPIANRYPYLANENTPLPLIVYTIDNFTPVYDKMGWVGDECTFSVEAFSNDYSNLQAVALQVRTALELKNGTYESIKIQNVYLEGQIETGYIDGFSNKLTFSTVVVGYA